MYKLKEYGKAASCYTKAFNAAGDQGKVKDRYSAARCWALVNKPDSAFFQLYWIVIKGKYSSYEEVLNETDLLTLHTDERWEPLIELMKKTRKEFEDALNNN